MADNYDLRTALADALPAAGPTRAAVKAMDDIGFKSDPKNNDMKELFVGLDLSGATTTTTAAKSGSPSTAGAVGGGERGGTDEAGAGTGGALVAGPSAAQVLLDYRREQKAAQKAAEEEAARLAAAGAGKGKGGAAPAIGGVGLARAAGVAGLEIEEAADDERHLRKMNLSKTAARMTSKQKRRQNQGKKHGTDYEEKHVGKVLNKSKRKCRMLAMKQMY